MEILQQSFRENENLHSVWVEKILSRCTLSESGCLEWTGYSNNKNNPMCRLNGKDVVVRRIVYGLKIQQYPLADVGPVRTFCENSKCIHPDHIYQGDKFPVLTLTPDTELTPLLFIMKQNLLKQFENCESTPEGCLLWTGACSGGYGVARYGGQEFACVRLAWGLHKNILPVPDRNEDGSFVYIQPMCGNKLCVNPEHLERLNVRKNLGAVKEPHVSIPRDVVRLFLGKDMNKHVIWTRLLANAEYSDKTACLTWTGRKDANGYGKTSYKNKERFVHRLSWEFSNQIIEKDKVIRHMCNNRACFNPKHLEIGTHLDNSNDTITSGNSGRGEKHHNAKITAEVVVAIAESRKTRGEPGYRTCEQRAAHFKVSLQTVKDIDTGRSWGHVTGVQNPTHEAYKQAALDSRKRSLTLADILKLEKPIADKVEKSDDTEYEGTICHEFRGCLSSNGYGLIATQHRHLHVHAVMLQIYEKRLRPDGMVARHLCHNRSCCNPLHLKWGTQQENMLDTIKDGRTTSSKLTIPQVIEIKKELARKDRRTLEQIAQYYGVSGTAIKAIKSGKTWSFVEIENQC